MKPFCAAIDWGTSTFRIWLLSQHGNPMIVRKSDEGALKVPRTGFATIVDDYLENFSVDENLPVIICGMAGARDGWKEAGYLKLPAQIDDICQYAISVPHKTRDIRILPGITQKNMLEPDVMRGEETQLLGLKGGLPETSVICMPGTHSKWIEYQNGSVTGFTSFMTGELYDLISRYSILADDYANTHEIDPKNQTFVRSVVEAYRDPVRITNHLFRIRASNLLGYSSTVNNAAAISGCLIGLELAAGLKKYRSPDQILLLAHEHLLDLYQTAFDAIKLHVISRNSEQVTVAGLFEAALRIWPELRLDD